MHDIKKSQTYRKLERAKRLVALQALPSGEASSAAAGDSSAPSTSSAPADGADFIPSETFTGSKLGYVFQAGSLGTGYYKDGVDKGLPLPPPLPVAGLTLIISLRPCPSWAVPFALAN